jgi:serine/threonine-protein kinase
MRTLLGRGGMGEIWLAYDVRVDREVAVKVMRGDGSHDSDGVSRFLREARVQGRLEHPAIVPVHDLGIGDAPFFVMKRLAGTTLADVLAAKAKRDPDANERWPMRTLLARLVDVCLAIELAHRRGVIHRDLKPANIMLGDFGEAYVLDWGLARIHETADADAIRASDLPSDPSGGAQTVVGAMLGTPGYMAPEQVRGEAVDHRVDIYALGCILFEILAGEPAVPRDSAIEATLAGGGFRPSRAGEVAPELDDTCARATAALPSARHASARALADDIQRFLDGDRDLALRRDLAAQHVAAAERALATGDAGRADATREAGRAIAIDPENRPAQDLMKRLLFELPSEMPPEARSALEMDRQLATQSAIHAATYAYSIYSVLPLIGLALGARLTWQFVTLMVVCVAAVATCWAFARKPRAATAGLVAWLLGLHTTSLIIGGLIVGPLLIVPVVLVGAAAMTQSVPSVDIRWKAFVAHLVAFAVPFALEWAGVVPRSFRIDGTALVLDAPGIHIDAHSITGILIGVIFVQLLVNTLIARNQRRAQERAEEKLHVYTWHLAQLVR